MTVIGILHITLAVPASSLKEKRTIVRSTIERLRNRYNAGVAEVADLDIPTRAVIAAVCISNEGGHAQSQLQHIADSVAEWRLDVDVLDIETELIHV